MLFESQLTVAAFPARRRGRGVGAGIDDGSTILIMKNKFVYGFFPSQRHIEDRSRRACSCKFWVSEDEDLNKWPFSLTEDVDEFWDLHREACEGNLFSIIG